MARLKLNRIAGSAALLFAGACAGLDVTNQNNPDITRALASGEDVKSIAISTMNSWYLASTYVEPYLMLSVTADLLTGNFGNFGMRFNNEEPRIAYENSSAGGDRAVTEQPWNQNYSTLGAANDVIRAIDKGVQINGGLENAKWRALAAFTQAASLTNLALLFDRSFIVDEATTGAPVLVDYNAVSTATVAKWDALVTALAGKSETYGATVLPTTNSVTLTSSTLRRFASSMAAATLRLTPRTPAELAAKPASFWTQILTYAEAGLSGNGNPTPISIFVQGDNNNWYSYINYYGNEDQWTRVDYRLLNEMENAGGACGNAIPIRYSGTSDIRAPGCPGTNDQRLADGDVGKWGVLTAPNRDFRYYGDHPTASRRVIGDPGRGIWKQSAYEHERYQPHSRSAPTRAQTPVPYMLAAENDLMIAEALVMSGGSKTRAAQLINNSRVTRGGLSQLTGAESNAVLLAAIDYEREVELFNTNDFGFFYARSSPVASSLGANTSGGRLQPGTLRHLPIPAKELETLALAIYTYGGVGKADMVVMGANGELLPLRRPQSRMRPAEDFFRH